MSPVLLFRGVDLDRLVEELLGFLTPFPYQARRPRVVIGSRAVRFLVNLFHAEPVVPVNALLLHLALLGIPVMKEADV